MKQRTLPQSFWIPPEITESSMFNPGINDSVVPIGPAETRVENIKITSPPDTHLLFSLFKILKQEHRNNQSDNLTMKTTCSNHTDDGNSNMSIKQNNHQTFDDDATYDSSELFEKADDPYLYKTEANVISQAEFTSNYSDLLSDLVVKL